MMNEKTILKIGSKEYTVGFPTVGEFYQIEAMKQTLSRGNYTAMVTNPIASSQLALDMIDIEATLTVLCPDLIKDLKVDSISKLDVRDFKVIRDAYNTAIVPFFKEMMSMLSGVASDEDK